MTPIMSGQQRRYMSKRQRPCDFCRSRKTACRIDPAPPCRLCVLHGRDCTFVEGTAPRKRLLPSDEIKDRAVAQPDSQEPMPITTAPSPAHPLPRGQEDQASHGDEMTFVDSLNFDTTQSEFEAMFQSPRAFSTPSTVWASITPRQPGSREHIEYPPGANPQLLGLSGDMDPLLLRHYRTDESGMFGFKELAIHSVQDSSMPCQFLLSQQSIFSRRRDECGVDRPTEDALSAQLARIVPAAVGARLITLFRDFVQPQFPIFATSLFPDPTSTPAYLLAAIYAMSLPFVVYDDKLSVDVAYDKPPYPALSQIIDKALSYELHSPSIPVAQTLLLLVLRPSADPLVADTAYRRDVLGRLVSCATTLGLHLDPSDWSMPERQKAHRRRLSFVIYAVDTWIASTHGTPPSTHRDNWLVTNWEPGDFVDSGLGSDDESRLMDFATITGVLSSALASLYSVRAIHELSKSCGGVSTVTQPLLQALASIPQPSSPESSARNLALSYTQLVILRAELRPSLAPGSQLGPDEGNFARTVRGKTKSCTRALTDVIRSLSPDTDGMFWPSWTQLVFSSICFSLVTMTVSSPDFDEASAWIADLQSARKSLRLKVASFPFLRLGLLRIDALFWRGITNVLHLETHVEEAFRAAELV
ncbi:fungal specific transcription factor domain-containing protein [Colletotrichum graminicola]|uniref:Fungal specific transcription factor domain-containing protein n=1 Tax=Colletotrichum graminicola (strain M1.001 / M2 / FGSC 10212) TaxID=645133 RepID=E3QUQ1_COLGM|nr:fungal specific transcription factor domain-containing protein [Colletotrichum graminicola M1.001]EFQ34589.1 fungal specific transcription factor domain-containing protein [Colletotrichum graminicola M1.001]WDK22673.1 fungal specific transcription factor domain-containing protein [Colletotrichum graminicola]